jgi:type I restriction enzyme, R subunit
MDPEDQARQKIDHMLIESGWVIQNKDQINLGEGLGVAVREYHTSNGPVDYALFVDRNPVGVVEAKKEGFPLRGVTEQSEKYLQGLEEKFPNTKIKPPLSYETTGGETLFADRRDPDYRSREVFTFHRPETIEEILRESTTLRKNLRDIPTLNYENLRKCQIDAITGLEKSFAANRSKSLIQMATGSGKTFAAVTSIYRLLKFAKAKRILFLVDRNNLGTQALKEFQNYETPDDGRKFTELYEVQHLESHVIGNVDVVITTVQRMYSMLKGEKELDSEYEEDSMFETPDDGVVLEIKYNKNIPIGMFDFIIVDECHRSIYNKWKHILRYFDSFLIGLTATPSKQTFGFFNGNLVTEYSHERAIADRVNVGYNVFRIKTKITEKGSEVEKGVFVEKRNKLTRQQRTEKLDEKLEYQGNQLDRDVVAPSQIRLVIQTFKDGLKEMFPDRNIVPKTLIFAKNDNHAEEITKITREVFDKGNEFCKKITYRTTGEKPKKLIKEFQNDPRLRIAVTVDMIATGTDIKPLECIIFMRDVRSQLYFDQMKGRGTRVIDPDDLLAVTPDAKSKDMFWIVDAVGVCEHAMTDTHSLEKKKGVSLEVLMQKASEQRADEDDLETLVSRLSRLDQKLDSSQRQEIANVSGGKQIPQIINEILDGIDTDNQINKAKMQFNTENPTEKQIQQVAEEQIRETSKIFDSPKFRKTVADIKKQNEIIIDIISIDELEEAGLSEQARVQSMKTIESFKDFIEENKDEITALSIIYSKSAKMQEITFNNIKELAQKIKKPPYNLTPEQLWTAYKRLEKSRVKDNPKKILTDLISIVRFSLGNQDMLIPFTNIVNEKFNQWISTQKSMGNIFSLEQKEWLIMIKDHIAASAEIKIEDMDYAPFNQKGGRIKFYEMFGDNYEKMLSEMHEALVSI